MIPLRDAEPVAEDDGELRHGGGPLALGIFPVLTDAAQDQIEQLEGGLVIGEMPAAANGGSQGAVEAFDRVGGVEDPPHLGREGEERDHLIPLPPP